MDSIQSITTLTVLHFLYLSRYHQKPGNHVEFAFHEGLEEGHKHAILHVLFISLLDQENIHCPTGFELTRYTRWFV